MSDQTGHQLKKYHERPQPSFINTLKVKLTLYLFALFLVLIITTYAVLAYTEKTILHEREYKFTHELGNNIVSEISNRVAQTESLTKSIARLAESLDKKPEIYMNNFPGIIDFQGLDTIAGGGIWPEPHQFVSDRKRSSFFWGRDKDGSLQFYDDYNDPNGPGYHNEEWYVPARFLDKDNVYWSKSYMDPYSFEPMVTCTAPIYENDQFTGVTTIDLKLKGLNEFFNQKAASFGGYLFAVDRNNKLLSFPDPQISKRVTVTDGNRSEEYKDMEEIQRDLPSLRKLYLELKKINDSLINNQKGNKSIEQQAKTIAATSYQIEPQEGLLISSFINSKISEEESYFFIENDPLLKETAMHSIFIMPETGWKLVVATPLAKINAFTLKVKYSLLSMLVIVEFAILAIMAYIFNFKITGPLNQMCQKLQQADVSENPVWVEENREDELGQLAYELNKRSSVIEDVIDQLKGSNLKLEKRVEERTTEIIEALKLLEEAKNNAEAANKSKSLFLANMSHEIRTPMNAILGYTDILTKKLTDPEHSRYLKIVRNSGKTLLSLINDILDLSKVEAGKLELRFGSINTRALFQSVPEQFAALLKQKNLKFNLEISENLPNAILIDETRIKQVLNNIIGNAIKFTEKGSITLKVFDFTESNELIFSIEDTGRGIPKEKLNNIFDSFEQVDHNEIEGTGLGLAITQKLIHIMNGNIEVTSEVNKGTKFVITISRVESFDITKQEDEESEKHYSFTEATILIADDVTLNKDMIKTYLEKFPFKIIEAENGKQAIEIAREHIPDLILMDIKMPVMNGIKATSIINEDKKLQNIPVIAITANAVKDAEAEIKKVFDAYLYKPIQQNSLLEVLSDFLQTSETLTTVLSEQEDSATCAEISDILENNFLKEIQQAAESLEISELNSLIKELTKLSVEKPSKIFRKWILALNTGFNNFDMEALAEELNKVKAVITELKSVS
ncbi:MAG: ATP-binding protein [Lentisphaerales bacterium]|nr:ATP-binding protein [Lentisphaerales bacterium]